MRTMCKEDYRVLAAVELGMKTHDLVPAQLCMQIAKLRHGGANKVMSGLLRDKLLSHDRSKGYDGYRLTNSGYDILALRNLFQRGVVAAIGDKIGIGKESDVYIAANKEGKQLVLKIHRLGRTSFRAVRNKRDYLMKGKDNQATSWLFMSRLSALKEFAFMKALHDVGYPTPAPLAHSRHIVAMSLVRGSPLYQVRARNEVSVQQAESIYEQSVTLAARLARHGLVHCDLNEFNLMVRPTPSPPRERDAHAPPRC
jgi:RIO kinase 2